MDTELTRVEALAAAAATNVIIESAPGKLPLDHPLVCANKKLTARAVELLDPDDDGNAENALIDPEGN